jgi:hypothetical protein
MAQMNCQRKLQRYVSLGSWAPEEINHQGFEYKEKLHKITPQQDHSPSMPFYELAHDYQIMSTITKILKFHLVKLLLVTQFQEPLLQQLKMA